VGNAVGVGDGAEVKVGCGDGVKVGASVFVGSRVAVGGGAVGDVLAHATKNATMRNDSARTANTFVFIFISPIMRSA
jgi:hypothetical protein